MERVITSWAKPQVALYDVGVGPKTEWRALSEKWSGIKLFGCEPYPPTYERLVPGWKQLGGQLLNVAISPPGRTCTLHYRPDDPKICSLLPVEQRLTRSMIVPSMTLDDFDELAGWQEAVLLWMDIEGFELQALRSGEKLMASGRVRWLNLEERLSPGPHPEWTDRHELDAFLRDHGYTRMCDYNRHGTHQDCIYKHKDEPCLRSR